MTILLLCIPAAVVAGFLGGVVFTLTMQDIGRRDRRLRHRRPF